MRIGVFGGSFNPVHNGHLKLAEEALTALNLQHIYFVPSYHTPLKGAGELLPAALRVRLLHAAIQGRPQFAISLCEIRRKGLSFTVDTIKYFRKKFGKSSVIYFLSGTDTLSQLPRWKSLPEILSLCRFVTMTRPGFSLSKLPQRGVVYMPFAALPISSTEIRERLEKGEEVHGLVPRATEALLKEYYSKKTEV